MWDLFGSVSPHAPITRYCNIKVIDDPTEEAQMKETLEPIEIVDYIPSGDHKKLQEDARRVWPDVTYGGEDICFDVYEKIMAAVSATGGLDDGYTQEVYLGYDMENGRFVIGYDTEIEKEDPDDDDDIIRSQTYVVQLLPEETLVIERRDYDTIFYMDSYDNVHTRFSRLADLRLD